MWMCFNVSKQTSRFEIPEEVNSTFCGGNYKPLLPLYIKVPQIFIQILIPSSEPHIRSDCGFLCASKLTKNCGFHSGENSKQSFFPVDLENQTRQTQLSPS